MNIKSTYKCVAVFSFALLLILQTAKAQSVSVCYGDSVVLRMMSSYSGTLQWQNSVNLINWTSMPGANADTIKVIPTLSTYYRVLISDSCPYFSDTATVTVFSPHAVMFDTVFADQCVNSPSFSLYSGTPQGGIYSGNGVFGGVFDPYTAGAGTHVITYTHTDGNGCSVSDTNSIVVYNQPVVNFNTALPDQCLSSTTFTLSGGTPSGGTYSGTGVTGTNFDASAAGIGTHNIVYTYTDSSGCSASDTNSILVITFPVAPLATVGSGATSVQITANWNNSSGATGYYLDVATDTGFSSIVPGYSALDVLNVTSYNVTGLACNVLYYYRVVAYNACGGSTFSNTISYSTLPCAGCGTPITDVRDGQTYNTVQIGTQCWLAQNMNIGVMVPMGGPCLTNNAVIEKLCYNDNPANCTIYGGLYQWAEAVQYLNGASNTTSWNPVPSGNVQGICPAGWHLPTDTECLTLETFLGGASVAGGKMKEAGTAHWASDPGCTNSSGFTALGSGTSNVCVLFENFNNHNCFWTSTEAFGNPAFGARFRFLRATFLNILSGDAGKTWGYSVRCIKD